MSSFPPRTHPVAFALWQAGMHDNLARSIVGRECVGMRAVPGLVAALRRERESMRLDVAMSGTCRQCRTGTNTWTLYGP